jgi:prevent-host-death family protein
MRHRGSNLWIVATRSYSVRETERQLSRIIRLVEEGEQIVITRRGRPIALLTSLKLNQTPRTPGTARGLLTVADKFDAPLDPELQRLFE